jgi:hypothetical protein
VTTQLQLIITIIIIIIIIKFFGFSYVLHLYVQYDAIHNDCYSPPTHTSGAAYGEVVACSEYCNETSASIS